MGGGLAVGGIIMATKSLFATDDGISGNELWVTDGTDTGTFMVLDINPGSNASDPSNFLAIGLGRMLFTADDGSHGTELWVTDASAAGTRMLLDINAAGASNPNWLTYIGGGKALFTATEGTDGTELWITDGTTAGTRLLKDINTGSASSNPANLFQMANGKVLFSANDGSSGTELWVTDGTTAGTTLLKDLNPGAASGNPAGFGLVSGKVTFVANDGAGHTRASWSTDGTAANTKVISNFGATPPTLTGAGPSQLSVDLLPVISVTSTTANALGYVNGPGTVVFLAGEVGGSTAVYDNGVLVGGSADHTLSLIDATGTGALNLRLDLTVQGVHNLVLTEALPTTPLRAGDPAYLFNSATFSVVVDTIAPGVPVVDGSPVDKLATVALQHFTGTAEALSLVGLYEGGTLQTTTTADASGNWAIDYTLVGETPAGQPGHRATFGATDRAGNFSGIAVTTANSRLISLDTIAPVVTVTGTTGHTNSTSQTISGTVVDVHPGQTMMVYDNGGASPIAQFTRLANNTFSSSVTLAGDGTHVLTVKNVDDYGNVGFSNTLTYDLDATAPVVTITSAGVLTATASQLITGMATDVHIGSLVTLYDNGNAVGTATIQGDGSWSTTVSLVEAGNSLVAKTTDTYGNLGASAAVVDVLDTIAPAVVVNSGITAATSATLTGTVTDAHRGPAVTIYEDGSATALTTVSVAADGTWSATVALVGEAVVHSFVATNTDLLGHLGTSAAGTLVLDTTAPTISVATTGGLTRNASAPISGTLTDLHATSVSIFRDGGATAVATTNVAADGSWSVVAPLGTDGAHSLVAKGFDAAGNFVTAAGVGFTLDTAAPVISLLADGTAPAPVSRLVFQELGSTLGRATGGYFSADGHGHLYMPTVNGILQKIDLATMTVTSTHVTDYLPGFTGAKVAFDLAGNMYGTANGWYSSTNGIVWEFPAGADPTAPATGQKPLWTSVYAFQGNGDGIAPGGGLVADSAGNLFGLTTGFVYSGGAPGTQNPNNTSGSVLYEIAAGSHAFSVVHSFNNGGQLAGGGQLTLDAEGNLYGQATGPGYGDGIVYKIAAGTHAYSVLHTFDQTVDGYLGRDSTGSVLLDAAGNLYGTAPGDRINGNYQYPATLWKLDTHTGQTTVLANFYTTSTDSSPFRYPTGQMVMDSHGNIYGTDDNAIGPNSRGVLWEYRADTHDIVVLKQFTDGTGSPYTFPSGLYLLDDNRLIVGTNAEGRVYVELLTLNPAARFTNQAQHTLSGTGEYGTPVVITDNGSLVATTAVAADGTWSYVITLAG